MSHFAIVCFLSKAAVFFLMVSSDGRPGRQREVAVAVWRECVYWFIFDMFSC